MATLAASAVSQYPTNLSREVFPRGKGDRTVVERQLKLVLTGQGGATNTITAAALGFKTLHSCSNLNDTANGKLYLAAVNPVANTIELAVDSADTIADVTSTDSYITVVGTPTVTSA